MTDLPVLEAVGLTKHFGKVQALDGLDLVAQRGQVTAVLGPNGAGKTTFVRSVATLVRPDRGALTVAGVDALRHPKHVRRLIGLAGQYSALEGAMTGYENLVMVARLYGHDHYSARRYAFMVLEQMRLVDAGNRLVRTFSGGMQRRLDLGASLMGAPRLLLLDEPTAGLDPRSRVELWDAIRALVGSGTDVLLTTQYLDEADNLASEIAIVDHGRVIARGTPAELKDRAGRDVIEVHAPDPEDLPDLAAVLAGAGTDEPRIDLGTRRVTVSVDGATSVIPQVLNTFDQKDLHVDDISLRRPTLNEVFLALTGNPSNGQSDTDSTSDADRTEADGATRSPSASRSQATYPTAVSDDEVIRD